MMQRRLDELHVLECPVTKEEIKAADIMAGRVAANEELIKSGVVLSQESGVARGRVSRGAQVPDSAVFTASSRSRTANGI